MIFQEELLHFVWKFRRFNPLQLTTACGMPIEIISTGLHNTDAGPDFRNALLRIGDTLWAGNVEIHIRSSDWNKHKHNSDAAYDNVILHVVFEDDVPVFRTNGTLIPTLVLKDRIEETLFLRYHELAFAKQNFIACEIHISRVDAFVRQNWLDRLLIERMENRFVAITNQVEKNRGDWDETFYQMLARNFGFKVNALPFELLATSLPQKIMSWHKSNAKQIEALIFGQAGFLEDDLRDNYPQDLQQEYRFLNRKYRLKPMGKHLWKFFRLRPVNFPTIRLAQFASIMSQSEHLFSKMIQFERVEEWKQLFILSNINPYWDNHFQFDKPSANIQKNMGDDAIENILINTVAPFLFAYGKAYGKRKFIYRSMQLLENIPAENNKITKGFVALEIKPDSAQNSQALIELKQHYCDNRRCLQCAIGCQLLKPAK